MEKKKIWCFAVSLVFCMAFVAAGCVQSNKPKVSITNKAELTAVWTEGDADRTVEVSAGDAEVIVSTDNSSVVKVSGMTLTAVGGGSATVTVSDGTSSDSVAITVLPKKTGIEITNKAALVDVWVVGDTDRTVEAIYTTTKDDTATEEMTVTSSNSAVIEVNGRILHAKSQGTATITVAGAGFTDTVSISVRPALETLNVTDKDELSAEWAIGTMREMTDDELDAAVKKTTVFARVSPADKMRIIQSLKRNGEIAAMTGDGVNDSPALKEADIGISMGITGTDVAKDSADMILMDDNFTTIEAAVREGRRVYRNIQKVIQFLVAGNIAEILTLFLAVCFNWADPILAVHILLINLATDSLPAIALGVDPADSNVMKTKPIKSGTLFADGLLFRIILHGIFISVATLAAYWLGELYFGDHAEAMTMTFIVLAFSQLLHSLNQRSNYDSIFTRNKEHNFYLLGAMCVSAAIALLVLLVPPLQGFFKFVPLGWREWLAAAGLSLFPLAAVEVSKIFMRAAKRGKK